MSGGRPGRWLFHAQEENYILIIRSQVSMASRVRPDSASLLSASTASMVCSTPAVSNGEIAREKAACVRRDVPPFAALA